MPTAAHPAAPELTWCRHQDGYVVGAILCMGRGRSDRLVECVTCHRTYMASELAPLLSSALQTPPLGAIPHSGAANAHLAQERARGIERTGNMSVPTNTTERPAGEPAPQNDERQPEDLGEGFIVGNLTEDPELRFTPTGRGVAKLRVAYTARTKDPESGRWADGETEFYTVTVWGQQGEHCAEHLQRGDRIVAAGQWTKRFWTSREGEPRESVELTARDVGPSLLFRGAIVKRTDRNKGARSDA